MVDEVVPIVETEETREDVECAVTGCVGNVDITPKAFQCGGAELFFLGKKTCRLKELLYVCNVITKKIVTKIVVTKKYVI